MTKQSYLVNNFKLRNREDVINLAVEILRIYNVRASEVLGIAKYNRLRNGNYVIESRKGSHHTIITDRTIIEHLNVLYTNADSLLFEGISYKNLYNYMLKNYSHIFNQFKTMKNRKVTHGFRYLNVHDVADATIRQAILHHKSLKTQNYYKSKQTGTTNGKVS